MGRPGHLVEHADLTEPSRFRWGFKSDSTCRLEMEAGMMARPYSNDLRDRVVASVELEGMSCRQTAARFGVAISTVVKWVRPFRGTGSVAPGQMGGHRRKKISGAHHDWLVARCGGKAFTLRGLVAELGERGLRVSVSVTSSAFMVVHSFQAMM